MGFASTSTVHLYLSRLEEKGYIEREAGKSRSFRPVVNKTGIRLLGRVHAGLPVEVEEYSDEFIDLCSLTPYPTDEMFALRVVGDSMINAGIFEGDIVVVLKTTEIRDGETAVAMVDGEVTVKTFYREDGHIRLQPENKHFAPIITDNAKILGKVVTLIRKYI